MPENRLTAMMLALLLVVSAVGAGASVAMAGATVSEADAYAGSHVSYDMTSNAIVDYHVGDVTMFDAVQVQSQSEAESSGEVDVDQDLSLITELEGSDVSMESESETSAMITAESGAEIHAHDNDRGIMIVKAGDESHYATIDLSSEADAEVEDESRVVVSTDDGVEGAFVVIGEGDVTVNADGDVSAELEGDSELVFRTYAEERSDEDKIEEELIADGQAVAEVFVMAQADAAGEAAIDVVQYSQETTVEVTHTAEGELRMTAEGTQNEGEVVIASISEAIVESSEELEVTLDGEVIAQASTYSEFQSSLEDDDAEFFLRSDSGVDGAMDLIVSGEHLVDSELVLNSSGEVDADAVIDQFAGANTEFDVTSEGIVDYSVGGETLLEEVKVQSTSEAESQSGIDSSLGLSSITDFIGAVLSVSGESETSLTLESDSGAEITAHDNERSIFVVHSGDDSQYVGVNVSASSEAESESESRVVLNNDDGSEGVFIVVGDGQVTVNNDGHVSAELGAESDLVFRAYADERTDEDEQTEQLIADGTAAAEVYVTQQADAGGEVVTDVVQYSQDTTVEVTQYAEGQVEMTAERTQSEGQIIITTVSDAVLSSKDNLEVTIDGEAAAEASSYSELESAIDDGDAAKFMVAQSSSAEASADVLVAVDHFSERQISMHEADDDASDDAADDDSIPGFGVGVAVIALLTSLAMRIRLG